MTEQTKGTKTKAAEPTEARTDGLSEHAAENAQLTTAEPSVAEHGGQEVKVADVATPKEPKGREHFGKGGVYQMKGGKRVPVSELD